MFGTIVNAVLIVIGGSIGTIFGNKINAKYTNSIMTVMGLVVACIGIQGAAGTKSFLVVVLSMVFGIIIGIFFKLDDRINSAGDWAKNKLQNTPLCKGPFADAVVTSSVLFSVGTMAILGSIQAGLNHDYTILFTKSVMDFITSIAFASALGPGVILSAIPVFLFQGFVTILAGTAEPILTPEVINEMSAVGGPIFLAMSANLINLRTERFKVGDMLPAIFLPIAFIPLIKFLGLW